MSNSTLSITDIEVFKKLSNPQIVEFKDDANTKAVLQMQNAINKAAEIDNAEEPQKSALQSAEIEEQNAEAVPMNRSSDHGNKTPLQPSTPKCADSPSQVKHTATSSQDEKLEKQGYLIELSNLKQKGVELSREFTMDDSLEELEFEVSKQNNNISTRNTVIFMRDMLRIIINGLEISNNRFGPFLSINGWSESCTQDMQKYEHSLEKIYKLYFRKSQMSPIMELAWLIFGSMIAWHFKSKFFGPASNQSMPQEKETEKFTTKSAPQVSSTPRSQRKDMPQKSSRSVLRPPNF